MATADAVRGVRGAPEPEPKVREHINLMLDQTNNPRRLRTVQHLMSRPGSRVFVPQSDAGNVLFTRLLDLDAIYAAVSRKLWQGSDPNGLQTKQGLESALMAVNRTLIQVTAEMAVDHGVSDSRVDAPVAEAIRLIKTERGAAKATEKAAGAMASTNPDGVTQPKKGARSKVQATAGLGESVEVSGMPESSPEPALPAG